MNAKRTVLASLAAAACLTTSSAFADASDTWVEYQNARGLPTTATPSNPAVSSDRLIVEMSRSEGGGGQAGPTRAIRTPGGNGNGHTSTNGHAGGPSSPKGECPAEFLAEMARTEGNPQGIDRVCG